MARRPTVALLIETSNTYARELLHGVRAFLRERRPWSLHFSEHGRGQTAPGWVRQWKGDGILARVENAATAAVIRRTRIPAVDVSFASERSPFPRVVTDSRAVTRLAAQHLLERGFHQFGYCGDSRHHWSNLRSRYFTEQVGQAGFPCEAFSMAEGSLSWEQELAAITRWIGNLRKPVGVMACYDVRAYQVLEACRRLGVEVPDEVAVIGVHNDELLCDLCDPPLTSVIPNARRAGYEAAAILQRMMDGERINAQSVYVEPIGVATRQSTDVVAINDRRISSAVRYIREHACENITVRDVLRAVPVSRSWLERRFKQHFGLTPHDQILRVRMDRVKAMLATTDLPLAVVAERTGFEHVEYLSVAFKRSTGLSPSRYRAQAVVQAER